MLIFLDAIREKILGLKKRKSLFIILILLCLLIATFFLISLQKEQTIINSNAATVTQTGPKTAAEYEQLLRGTINGKWYHGDFGQSVQLPNGNVLWVFGDTLIGNAGATRAYTMINNSAILVNGNSASALTGPIVSGKETSWIKPNAVTDDPSHPDDYYWANTPFIDGSKLQLFLSHMYNDGSGGLFSFHTIGVDLATFDVSGDTLILTSLVKTPGSASGENRPFWGVGVYKDIQYTYILGNINKHEPWIFGHYYYVARVPNGQIENPSSWEYWNGSAYTKDIASAAEIISGTVGVGSGTTFYKDTTGKFVIVSKKYDIVGTDLVAWKADSPTGPWIEVTPPLLAPIPMPTPTSSGDYISYLGLVHPWAQLSSGKMLASWSFNATNQGPSGDIRYGIHFAEVDLAPIAPTNTPTPRIRPPLTQPAFPKNLTITPTRTRPPAPQTFTQQFTTIADTYADGANPTKSRGNLSYSFVNKTSKQIMYLKFDLRPLANKKIISMTLKMRSGNYVNAYPKSIKYVSSTSWTEKSMIYKNKPNLGSTIGTIKANKKNTWVTSSEISSGLKANVGKIVTLAIEQTAAANSPASFSSKESSYVPVLIVTYQD